MAKTTDSKKKVSRRGASLSQSKRRRNLLIELGTEELPPQALKKLAEAFSKRIFDGLFASGVVDETSEHRYFATPRRLALWVSRVAPSQPDRSEERRGPSLKAAYDQQGNPTKAALGFARSCQVPLDKIEIKKTDKGDWLVFQNEIKGQSLNQIVDTCLADSVRQLPIPRRMRWGESQVEFVRPVHWLVALYGSEILDSQVLGFQASNVSRGHRFHANHEIQIPSADRYATVLKTEGFIIADYQLRQQQIEKQILRLAKKAGAEAVINPDLLDLVTGLVEWPQALIGEFDVDFLNIPAEVLISSMRDHQKYFHLVDEAGKVLPKFITVSNIKSRSPKRVRQGNERVLRARLSDADFFWNSDQKIPLDDRVASLKRVLFHYKLGSVHDKAARLAIVSGHIIEKITKKADEKVSNRALTERAAWLCKTDLVTDMVGEFPELQGVVGRYYAANQGEKKAVYRSIDDHYKPRFSGDQLPGDVVSQSLALADRIDTLTGIFLAGEIPTGDKDPFALRRAALGVLRIMIEKKLDLDLESLIRIAIDGHNSEIQNKDPEEVVTQVFDFVLERLKAYYQAKGFSLDEINAVLICRPRSPLDFNRRIVALSKFFKKRQSAAQSLAFANKRIANILTKNSDKNPDAGDHAKPNLGLIQQGAEMQLYQELVKIQSVAGELLEQRDYNSLFELLAKLRDPIDAFFDEVMVMDPDAQIRANRLAILANLRTLFLGAADISLVRHG